jgi:hypothetical protein
MKASSWRSVSGVIVIAAALVSVLKYARTGRLRGEKFRLYVAVPDAANLLPGSDVWLNGQRVGNVVSIGFAPATTDPEVRVVIAADVLARMRDHIRFDSKVALRSGGTIIGAPVVYVFGGSMTTRAVVSGDTIRGAGKSDFQIAASRATEAMDEVPGILSDAKIIVANARGAGTRLSGIVNQERASGSLSAQSRALIAKLTTDRGSAGRLMRDREIRRQIGSAMAATDSLRTLLAKRMNEVGRFRRDSTLSRSIGALRADIAQLRTLAASPTGTVGRITTDSALVRALDSVFVELGALMADIKQNPRRYARVF